MKSILFVIICTGFSFCNSSNTFLPPDYIYKNSGIELQFKYINKNKDSIGFSLTIDSIELKNFSGIATLVLIEDVDGKMIVPVGTNREDYNNPTDIMGYKCDSTYSYISNDETLHISFSMESNLKHIKFEEDSIDRLDFHFLRYNKDNTKTELDINKTLLLCSDHQKNIEW